LKNVAVEGEIKEWTEKLNLIYFVCSNW